MNNVIIIESYNYNEIMGLRDYVIEEKLKHEKYAKNFDYLKLEQRLI